MLKAKSVTDVNRIQRPPISLKSEKLKVLLMFIVDWNLVDVASVKEDCEEHGGRGAMRLEVLKRPTIKL